MYAREFIAGVLAGFENALDVLLEGAELEIKTELVDLTMQIRSARNRIDPGWALEECAQTELNADSPGGLSYQTAERPLPNRKI